MVLTGKLVFAALPEQTQHECMTASTAQIYVGTAWHQPHVGAEQEALKGETYCPGLKQSSAGRFQQYN